MTGCKFQLIKVKLKKTIVEPYNFIIACKQKDPHLSISKYISHIMDEKLATVLVVACVLMGIALILLLVGIVQGWFNKNPSCECPTCSPNPPATILQTVKDIISSPLLSTNNSSNSSTTLCEKLPTKTCTNPLFFQIDQFVEGKTYISNKIVNFQKTLILPQIVRKGYVSFSLHDFLSQDPGSELKSVGCQPQWSVTHPVNYITLYVGEKPSGASRSSVLLKQEYMRSRDLAFTPNTVIDGPGTQVVLDETILDSTQYSKGYKSEYHTYLTGLLYNRYFPTGRNESIIFDGGPYQLIDAYFDHTSLPQRTVLTLIFSTRPQVSDKSSDMDTISTMQKGSIYVYPIDP
jgi:hypothetical protein